MDPITASLLIELIKVAISSAYTLAELAGLSDIDREKLFQEEFAKVKARNPADLPKL